MPWEELGKSKVSIDQSSPGISNGVTLTGSNVEDVVFHDATTVAANGTTYMVGGKKTLTIEIYGTSTAKTLAFMGVGASGTPHPIMGVRLSDLSTATSSIGTAVIPEFWQFDITGLTSVIMVLTTIANGNVTVKGKAVA